MHGCMKIRLHQPVWASVPTHTKTCCFFHSSPRTAICDAEGLGNRAWGGCLQQSVLLSRCQVPHAAPKINAASEGVGKGQVLSAGCWQESCAYPRAEAAGACDSSSRPSLNWARTSKKCQLLPPSLGFATWFSTTSSCGRRWWGRSVVKGSQQRCKDAFQHGCSVHSQPDPRAQVWSVSGIFEDQGVLRGCVCTENFQWPWTG